jgi:threonyl-tRNA synthetase
VIIQLFDLCRGGHIPNTGIIKAMKILSVAVLIGEVMKKTNS